MPVQLGYENNFTILDQTDAEDVVNLIRTQQKLDMKEKRFPRKETLYDLYSRSLNTDNVRKRFTGNGLSAVS